jgi:NAD(P)-dependent dehydrogenase (short-subunit alcohol dehydrogenase family)
MQASSGPRIAMVTGAGSGIGRAVALEQWHSVLDTNVTGVYLCARAAFGLMRRQSPQGGRIINNGSVSAYKPRLFTAPYTASKYAVLGLTKGLRWTVALSTLRPAKSISVMR